MSPEKRGWARHSNQQGENDGRPGGAKGGWGGDTT